MDPMKLARPILLLTLPLLFGGLACAQGKGADRQLRKAEKAVLKRAGQHFAARHPDRLLKKGSRLRVNARSVRPQAAAAAFIGMAHPAYREAYKGKEEAWFKRLLQRKGRWHGQPLIVERWKALAVVAHRDAVTVDALVTFAGRKAGEARLIRQVWVKKERGLYPVKSCEDKCVGADTLCDNSCGHSTQYCWSPDTRQCLSVKETSEKVGNC